MKNISIYIKIILIIIIFGTITINFKENLSKNKHNPNKQKTEIKEHNNLITVQNIDQVTISKIENNQEVGVIKLNKEQIDQIKNDLYSIKEIEMCDCISTPNYILTINNKYKINISDDIDDMTITDNSSQNKYYQVYIPSTLKEYIKSLL